MVHSGNTPAIPYPQPPVDMVMPAEWQFYLTIVFGAFAAVAWLYAFYLSAKTRSLLPILVLLGGSVAYLMESLVDVLGMCYWPEIGQITGYRTFGRSIPLFNIFCYMCFFGGVVLFTLRQFEKGIPYRETWKWFFIWMLFEFTWEPIPIHYGVWAYYGAQPFVLFDFPLWWPPVNTVGAYTAALLIHKLMPYLKGPWQLLIVFLIASGDIMGNAAVGWPVWSALNTDYGYAATIPAGIVMLFLTAFAIHVIAKIVEGGAQAPAWAIEKQTPGTMPASQSGS